MYIIFYDKITDGRQIWRDPMLVLYM